MGRSNQQLVPTSLRGEIRRLHERAFGGEVVSRFPTLQVRNDGTEVAVAMTIVPMRDSAGAVSSVACIATPIGNATRELSGASARVESHVRRLSLDLTTH